MFTFLHCADLHLDSPLKGLSARPDAPVDTIRSATRRALENLVALAVEESVRFVVIAGDVYDGDWQDYQTGLFFNSAMARLGRADIPVYLVSGNHDAANRMTRSLVSPPNVHRFATESAETRILESERVALHGQGFHQREVRDNLVPGYPDALPGYFNIGILHTSVEGQEGHMPYAPCRVEDLVQKGYDYWALGHVHRRQVLRTDPHIVYPGNLQGRHIRETGAKGATLVAVDGGRVIGCEHRNLDVLRWEVCPVDLNGAATQREWVGRVMAALEACVRRHPGYPLAVRVQLQGRTALHADLIAHREAVRVEVENAVAQMGSADLWIEKVAVDTEPVAAAVEFPHQEDAVALLQQTVAEAAEDDDFLEECFKQFQAVQHRLGAYTRQPDATVLESPSDLKPLLQDARAILAEGVRKGGLDR